MCDSKREKVLIGTEEYIYQRNNDGEETLTRFEKINDEDIEIVIRSKESEKSKEIEKFVIDVLSDLYIERNLKKFI